MPNIKDESTVEAIAREFCSNGRNKEKGMLDVGYEPSYARGGRGQGIVYANERVRAAIARIDAKTRTKSVKSREERKQFWTDMMDDDTASRADRLRASELLGKSECDFVTVTQDITEKPLDITPEQAQRYSDMAAIANRENISISKEKIA